MKKKVRSLLSPVSRTKGGISVSHHKNTEDCITLRMTDVETISLPMLQHMGAPCTPVVAVGDKVDVGQIIGDSDKNMSVPIHASVSGEVSAIGPIKTADGKTVQAVTIKSDGEMRLHSELCPPEIKSRRDFIKAVRASGLVGLGGAGFPTHVKLNVPPEKKIDTLIINGAECEPYITVDYRECIENADNVISGAALVQHYLGIENVIIAIEDNKPKAIEKISELADKENNIKVMALKSQYPQGAEKMTIYSATGRKVPLGGLPMDVGCMVMNISSVAFIDRYIKTGKPLVSRTLTVDGSAIASPKNVRVPIGTKISDVVDFCGGLAKNPFKVIIGGPLMGIALLNMDAPITKTHNAILAFKKGTYKVKTERDCIRCDRCAYVCPMHLIPTDIERYAKARDYENLIKSHADACMECGSCAFACPSSIPLVQYMVLGKEIIREADLNNE